MIVSDAGPIIIFTRIGRLPLLREVTSAITIPAAVHAEIAISGMPGATELAEAEWVQRASVAESSLLATLPSALHAGEREAIALAKERHAQLLMDEIRGRRAAVQLGIEVIGSLRILAEAKRFGHIDLVQPVIVEMQSSGYRFEQTLIGRFLEQMGEP
jgi:predicted nucleic acid-binding protein